MLGLQPLVGGPGELVRLRHAGRGYRRAPRRRPGFAGGRPDSGGEAVLTTSASALTARVPATISSPPPFDVRRCRPRLGCVTCPAMTHRIAVIGGDGIGPEVIAEALKVVRAAGVDLDTVDYDLGGARYLRDGRSCPTRCSTSCARFDAILLGAVGTPEVPPGVIERGLLLRMRFELDLYVNLRPFRHGPGTSIDFIVIRENTEGTYAGEGGFLRKGTPHEVATQGSVNTRMGVERCVRYAFELAAVPAPQAPHARAQDQRAHLRRRPLAAHVRRGRRRVPRRRHRLQPRRRGLHLLRAGPAALRRDRHRQPVRRHPHRPRRRGVAAASGSPRRPTSTRPAPARRCSSRSTARRPTSRAPARPTRSPPSCRRR